MSHSFYWTYPKTPKPAYWAFRAYRNYDGSGGHFLDRRDRPVDLAHGHVALAAP